jgi:hypothetical protein
MENLFSWLRGWFFFAEDFARYFTAALLITWTFGLIANGIAGPVVEEMYFPGICCRGSHVLGRGRRFSTRCSSRSTTSLHPG